MSSQERKSGGGSRGSIQVVILVAAVWLALLFGAQTMAWSWGPAMLLLAAAVVTSLVTGSRSPGRQGGALLLLVPVVLTSLWLGARIVVSPVEELARADGMLLASCLGCAWVAAGIGVRGRAIEWLHAGLAFAVLANAAIALVQWRDPSFTWPYPSRPSAEPTGLFGHYNYLSNFVVGAGALLLARACLARTSAGWRGLHALGFAAAVLCVTLSGSRGGLMALGVSLFLAVLGLTAVAWRRRWKVFPVLALCLPLMLLAGLAVGWFALRGIQEARDQGTDVVAVADNAARFRWVGLALKVSSNHPLVGGGSRSFSWERNREWTLEDYGVGRENERFVHNELVQTATDYGWLGAAGVAASACAMLWLALRSLVLGGRRHERDVDALGIGVLAAAGGILIQSNVSFVFHLLPSTMLLGILLGLTLVLGGDEQERRFAPPGWLRGGVAALIAGLLAWLGWRSADALWRVWPVFYGKPPLAAHDSGRALEQLDVAAGRWGGHRLHEERGHLARELAAVDEAAADRLNRTAVESYRRAAAAHPHHAGLAVNLANSLSALGEIEAADEQFERALELQGGLEAGFRVRFYYATHLYASWYRLWTSERRAPEALRAFEKADELLEEAAPMVTGMTKVKEIDPLRRGIRRSIEFLRGAGVEPAGP